MSPKRPLVHLLVIGCLLCSVVYQALIAGAAKGEDLFTPVSALLTAPTTDLLPPTGSVTAAKVYGPDDRVRVLPAVSFQRHVVYLEITDETGALSSCTGTIVGPGVVLTAAHCVQSNLGDPPIKSVRVVPGKDGESEPWGSQYARSNSYTRGWAELQYPEVAKHDFALLYLPDARLTERAGIFPGKLTVLSDSQLLADNFNPFIVGYAGDCHSSGCVGRDIGYLPYGTYQWAGSAPRFLGVDADFLYDEIDTWHGDSGAAVLRNSDGAIVGIHTLGMPKSNAEVRLTRRLASFFQESCASHAGCSLSVESPSSPTVTPTPTAPGVTPGIRRVNLKAGFNLMGGPTSGDMPVGPFLSCLPTDAWAAVYIWDAPNTIWLHYFNSALGTPSYVNSTSVGGIVSIPRYSGVAIISTRDVAAAAFPAAAGMTCP